MPTLPIVFVETLTPDAFKSYGWMMGKPMDLHGESPAFTSPASDFWREHLFDTGRSGETEVLWVAYRNNDATVTSLETHWLTQQAIVPLTGPITQLVALNTPSGGPDLKTLRAFRIPVGEGICMKPECWHATRVDGGQVKCLMLTRRSTTVDLVVHLMSGAPACESTVRIIETRHLAPRLTT
jgi:ureidoglycolate lyase